MGKSDGITRSTGRSRDEWFAELDSWGAGGREYREIADWLTGQHGVSKWWAQKLIVEYQEARGLRPPGVRRDGTFEIGTSKTLPVPVEVVFEAFTDSRKRKKWLEDGRMSLRTSQVGRSARFDWEDGTTRVNVAFIDKGPSKSTVSISHERLPDAAEAATAKERWKERLASLASSLNP